MSEYAFVAEVIAPVANGGLLPTRGSWMLDIVFLAMFAVVPVMFASIWLVRSGKRYALHRQIQIGMAAVLLIAVAAFEIDMQLFTDWRQLAAPSPWYASGLVDGALAVHLLFAIPTPFVWGWTIAGAWIGFPKPVQPGDYSKRHRFWGKLAAAMMTLTALTGWVFYYLAFVA